MIHKLRFARSVPFLLGIIGVRALPEKPLVLFADQWRRRAIFHLIDFFGSD